MSIIDGYWNEWVARPGDLVALHLSGSGSSTVKLHPLNGNQLLPPINNLVWTGDLVERNIVLGSRATEEILIGATTEWSLTFNLRIETAPTSDATIALVKCESDEFIEITSIGNRLKIVSGGQLVDFELEIGKWATVELAHESTSVCVGLIQQEKSDSKSLPTVHTNLSNPKTVTLGAHEINTAHMRICNVQINIDAIVRHLFTEPTKPEQRNNPVWGLADSSGTHNAIRFHPEDIGDVQWPVTAHFKLPTDLPSGVYVASCVGQSKITNIPIFVEPLTPNYRVAVVMSTFTYLAYAGYRQTTEAFVLGDYAKVTDRDVILTDVDRRLAKGIVPGLSLYDRYSDGVATYVVSRRHPLIDFRPGHSHWLTHTTRNFGTDLELLAWLKRNGIDVDILTDDRLHWEGVHSLEHYDTVITGSHPEYVSKAILDTLTNFTRTGGHILYLGGNGFDYVTEPSAASPNDTIEVRRSSQDWYGANRVDNRLSIGRLAGTWSDSGRPANQLMGVGYCTQGWGPAPGYQQLPDARTTRFGRSLLSGIGPDELIGDFGKSMGGAAGDEIDCVDVEQGSPTNTIRLASSEGLHTHHMMDVDEGKPLRADIAYTPNGSGGSVFAVGSMNWVTSLISDQTRNNVEILTMNAIKLAQEHARSANATSRTSASP